MNDVQTTGLLAPIVKSVFVALPPQAAFHLFTEGASRWWPLASHSVAGDDAIACVLEGRVGGRFYEVNRSGGQAEWGRVLAWEPPGCLVMNFYPGRSAADATEVEVTFQAEGSGTRLTLVHRRWEQCGPATQASYGGYGKGWDVVLGKYTDHARQAA
jgi:uncharacterized protein YndB with AHSA1/START domain